ncbi:hypothetical protein ACHAXR_004092 [Thalassiosira sp. AJA248-18]
MMKAMEKNPGEFVSPSNGSTSAGSRNVNANGRRVDIKKKPRRTRKRVDRPKQKYVYASQRRALEATSGSKNARKNNNQLDSDAMILEEGEDGTVLIAATATLSSKTSSNPQIPQAQEQNNQKQLNVELIRTLGLSPASQVADAIIGNSPEDIPRIVDRVRVDGNPSDDNASLESITSNSFAYVMYKPVGWSMLGEKKKKKKKIGDAAATTATASDNGLTGAPTSSSNKATTTSNNNANLKRVKAYDEQTDDFTFVEYNEADVLAVLTPEERDELMKEGGLSMVDDMADVAKGVLAGAEWDDGGDDDGLYDEGSSSSSKKKKKKKKSMADNTNNDAITSSPSANNNNNNNNNNMAPPPPPRMKANINPPSRPSLINWLKLQKATEGTPIKGGKNWVALAGATEIDDSGLVLLCPRDRIDAVHVDRCGYVAVVGNGKKMTSRSKLLKSVKGGSSSGGGGEVCDDSTARIDILTRLKRGRDADPVMTVGITFPDGMSTCSHAVVLCQDKFTDGVRGDALADALDRRASRRLVHCESMAVTSLVNLEDEPVVVEGCAVPDDVANYVGRRDGVGFRKGSFLGRQCGLGENGLTNAYREMNGAADGYPGWIVDRYDKWLFVQQEEGPMSAVRGPIPSLHDGFTAGVYYLPTKADRSIMGTEKLKPALLEGKVAPEFVPVMENGITYLVNLGESFSTGIFLDQRLQRAWLAEHCNEDTRVLNCFAHTGAFSVAAATAGAKTVSLDLDKKWLDRIRPQMEANGMEWEGQHDCIYGDCFDWLARLAKRGEQFDVVILDPPSTSVGKKKKRWSVKNDMAELVALAAPLVKSDGVLITTTNSASVRPEKFAKMCKKGLMDAGIANARLERVSPMPSDFSSIGSQPVKNLVWRIA